MALRRTPAGASRPQKQRTPQAHKSPRPHKPQLQGGLRSPGRTFGSLPPPPLPSGGGPPMGLGRTARQRTT
eukprot:2978441-Lingulodinium_polyedra.AAC.1